MLLLLPCRHRLLQSRQELLLNLDCMNRSDDLIAITVVGINCIDAVFNTIKVAMLSVILSLHGFFFCIVCIAFIPNGVAAFPIPSRFAIMFIVISLYSLSSFFIFGNKNFIIGPINFDNLFINDVFSTIFIRPFHKHIVPNNFMVKSTV